jgi:predicted nucleic acid-binding protein
MNKIKIYLDTSVISYLDQTDAPAEMETTLDFWDEIQSWKYEVYISETVIQELQGCKLEKYQKLMSFLDEIGYVVLTKNDELDHIADIIISEKILPKKSINDCVHIAFALSSHCDYLVSWNMKHLANIKTNMDVRVISLRERYKELFIVPPSMFLKGDIEND